MATILLLEWFANRELFHAATKINAKKPSWHVSIRSPLTRLSSWLGGIWRPFFRTHLRRVIRQEIGVCDTAKRTSQAAGNQQGLQYSPANPHLQSEKVRTNGAEIEIPS